MRAVVVPITAVFLAVLLNVQGQPARAVLGYESDYAGESAFLTIAPGSPQSFTVFFMNTGTIPWRTGSPSQVNLAVCLADKTTCNKLSPNAAWNDGSWLSPIAYATTTQDVVMPGELATFTYRISAPNGIEHATYRFNGDLVHAQTLQRIHPQGYYQDATVG